MDDLVQGGKYAVYDLRKSNTKFGDAVQVKLEDGWLYLPARYSEKILRKGISAIDTNCFFVFNGRNNSTNKNIINCEFVN